MTSAPRRVCLLALDQFSPTAKQIKDQHDHGDDDQHMDQVATDTTEKAQQPQNQKHKHNCPKHSLPPMFKFLSSASVSGTLARFNPIPVHVFNGTPIRAMFPSRIAQGRE
jgi:hypothetical protein